jgi:hypothetical protein
VKDGNIMSDFNNEETKSAPQLLDRGLKVLTIFAPVFVIIPLLVFNGEVRSLFGEISIDNLPAGDLIGVYDSPDKSYTAKA